MTNNKCAESLDQSIKGIEILIMGMESTPEELVNKIRMGVYKLLEEKNIRHQYVNATSFDQKAEIYRKGRMITIGSEKLTDLIMQEWTLSDSYKRGTREEYKEVFHSEKEILVYSNPEDTDTSLPYPTTIAALVTTKTTTSYMMKGKVKVERILKIGSYRDIQLDFQHEVNQLNEVLDRPCAFDEVYERAVELSEKCQEQYVAKYGKRRTFPE